jgi:hypothetical protein
MGDFPKQGGKAPAVPKAPIKSGVPSQGSPAGGMTKQGTGSGGVGNNDSRKAK